MIPEHTAIFKGAWNGVKRRAAIVDENDLQGLRTSLVSPPDTPPGKAETRVWVPTLEIRDLLDSKPQYQRLTEWEETE